MNSIVCKINDQSIDLLDKKNLFFSFLHTNNRHYLQQKPSNVGLDLLFVGLSVSLADRIISRDMTLDGWTRTIKIELPVIEYDKWIGLKKDLSNTLSFLSGDYWEIEFSKRSLTDYEKSFNSKKKRIKGSSFAFTDEVDFCMLSGGLDSFIGAIDLLTVNERKVVFVNLHGSGSSFEKNFNDAQDALCNSFNLSKTKELFRSYNVTLRGGRENTTRSRSFMFFTHALALATCYKNPRRLVIPENGTISLNVPLTSGRYGSCSTRTTHPYYISGLQRIIDGLGLRIKIENPYQFFTKGEMIENCKNKALLEESVTKTMSCSHPTSARYYQKIGTPIHCGYCLPCLIRKAAELKGFGRIITDDNSENTKKTSANQSTIRCLKARLHSYDESKALVDVLKNGRLASDVNSFKEIYSKSIEELKNLLDYLKE